MLMRVESLKRAASGQRRVNGAKHPVEIAARSGQHRCRREQFQDLSSLHCMFSANVEGSSARDAESTVIDFGQKPEDGAMKPTRREFVSTMALVGLGAQFAGARFAIAADARLPLAFSTLGCPKWTWPEILDFAAQHGFSGVELRGLLGEMNLPASPQFAANKIATDKSDVAAHGLKITDLGSSAAMHDADPQKRAQQLADARSFIDLAAALGAPYVRVFGNDIKGPREEVIARVVAGLRELGEYARPRNVTVIIESHGDFTDSPTLKEILTRADSDHVALLLGRAPHFRFLA